MLFNSIISINTMVKTGLKKHYWLSLGLFLFSVLPFYFFGFLYRYLQDEKKISQLIFFECPTFKFFNITCPTCGLGRSFISLFIGNWKDSWHYHPGGILIYTAIIGGVFLYICFPTLFFKVKQSYSKNGKLTVALFICFYFIWGTLRDPI